MEAKKTLTSEDKPGWYGCKNPQGKSVVMYWQGTNLYVGCDWSSPSTLSAFCEFVGPLIWPDEQADLPAVAKAVTAQIRAAGCWAEDFVLIKVVSDELRRLRMDGAPAVALDAPEEWIAQAREAVEFLRRNAVKQDPDNVRRIAALHSFIDACKPMVKAADDPEVIDRVLNRVSDALRGMGYGDAARWEIVPGLRARLLRKPFVLPEPGTAFVAMFPAGIAGQFYRFGNGRVFDSNGQEWTAEELNNAVIEEPNGKD